MQAFNKITVNKTIAQLHNKQWYVITSLNGRTITLEGLEGTFEPKDVLQTTSRIDLELANYLNDYTCHAGRLYHKQEERPVFISNKHKTLTSLVKAYLATLHTNDSATEASNG